MAIGDDHEQGTCTASRKGSTYVETCGPVRASAQNLPRKSPPASAKPRTTPRSSVQLTWQDNSDNETGFVIERCDEIFRDIHSAKMPVSCRGTWKTIGTVAPNVTSYVDDTTEVDHTYIYRVKATNQFGSSPYTPQVVTTAK
ncbi:MAG TPA: fibronectin type III domain-containing protein [Terriglobales bacterium]|nr:fibronectin type III domain-containing protein [Terriglobales bacterium]